MKIATGVVGGESLAFDWRAVSSEGHLERGYQGLELASARSQYMYTYPVLAHRRIPR